jgi:hypothetical protein
MPLLQQFFFAPAMLHRTVAIKIAILVALGAFSLAALLIAHSYTQDLVNYVVCQAFLQKRPPGVDPEQIQAAFENAMRVAQENGEARRNHLQKLFQISQRLEKLQQLTEKDAREMLQSLGR